MKTLLLLKLHKRQVEILEMIEVCEKRIVMWDADAKKYKETWLLDTVTHYREHSRRSAAIKERLIRYYMDVQKRIETFAPKIELTETEAAHAHVLDGFLS